MDLRAARPDEAGTLLAFVQAAFEGYRSFAPPGWEPPDELTAAKLAKVEAELADAESYSCVAFDGGELAGYTLWVRAIRPSEPGESLEGVTHVRAVFVAPSHWGTGLAARLLRDATAEMGRRGWAVARLFTPADQARARRFYEREGWLLHQDRYFEEKLGLDMVEYRRALG